MINSNTLNIIINEYNTPSYIFDENILIESIQNIKNHLPQNVKLCYAMKANPFLVEVLSTLVDRFEVCSPGEYEICKRCNIPPHKIIVSGINKTFESLKNIFLYSKGEGFYTIESPYQYELLRQTISDSDIQLIEKPKLLLRLSSGNQFGMDTSVLTAVYKKIIIDNLATVQGIHYYSGTQKNLKKIVKDITHLNKIKEALSDMDTSHLELEYGPGLSFPYFTNDDVDISTSLNEFTNELHSITAFTNITIELGRYIAANCGYYITKIIDIKSTNKSNYLIVDGGIHQLNYYGQLTGMKTPYLSLIRNKDAPQNTEDIQKYIICGSLCTSNDILVKTAELSSPHIDDYILFERCGAYSPTEGISLFLSRELPQVLLVHKNNEIEVLRDVIEINTLNSKK